MKGLKMSELKPRVLSAVQPTATLHIGNYFGAIANWVQLLPDHDCYYAVAVYHAMTLPFVPQQLRHNTEEMLLDLVACGIDPHKCILFLQSDVPEHFELMWILSCLAPFGELARMPQYREKSNALARNSAGGGTAGLACYPLLQAADILAYNADLVPVGRDQIQHLELARDLARRFNERFGEVLILPRPLFSNTPKIRSLAHPVAKMSKSLGERHYIGLFEAEAAVREKVNRAITDSGLSPENGEMSPGVRNLIEILRACGKHHEIKTLVSQFESGSLSYAHLKDVVGTSLVNLTSRLRKERAVVQASRGDILKMVHRHGEHARLIAHKTLEDVRKVVGVLTLAEAPHV